MKLEKKIQNIFRRQAFWGSGDEVLIEDLVDLIKKEKQKERKRRWNMTSHNIIYTWEKDNGRVKGVITFLNDEQFTKDELKMSLEMMKAGYTLIKKEIGGKELKKQK